MNDCTNREKFLPKDWFIVYGIRSWPGIVSSLRSCCELCGTSPVYKSVSCAINNCFALSKLLTTCTVWTEKLLHKKEINHGKLSLVYKSSTGSSKWNTQTSSIKSIYLPFYLSLLFLPISHRLLLALKLTDSAKKILHDFLEPNIHRQWVKPLTELYMCTHTVYTVRNICLNTYISFPKLGFKALHVKSDPCSQSLELLRWSPAKNKTQMFKHGLSDASSYFNCDSEDFWLIKCFGDVSSTR